EGSLAERRLGRGADERRSRLWEAARAEHWRRRCSARLARGARGRPLAHRPRPRSLIDCTAIMADLLHPDDSEDESQETPFDPEGAARAAEEEEAAEEEKPPR